ncbi:DB module domain-containing protein [Ditylenchus destructor]|uniref:DB module domain-containing protein n=1 Tax=Ditylenchus destructor TaxID=166010 RepID=A0AAD4NI65_9BILA|nr:DB module domain-containing protein [Ditylenchus destructor]
MSKTASHRFQRINLILFAGLTICLLKVAEACIGSGICGGGGGCYSPPPVSCGGGCSQGYQCGHYGCARVRSRVHSANTLALAGHESGNTVESFGPTRLSRTKQKLLSSEKQIPVERDPNQMFLACCEDRGLPDACLKRCNYNTYTKEALMGMYFRTDACPIEAAAELQYCAARGRDHRACCMRNSVQTTLAGEKCLTFCDQRPGNVTQLDFSYASCYDRFEQMKGCFWHSALAGF